MWILKLGGRPFYWTGSLWSKDLALVKRYRLEHEASTLTNQLHGATRAMDPQACLQRIADADLDSEDMIDACHDLRSWIARGGFVPDWSKCPEGTKRYNDSFAIAESSW